MDALEQYRIRTRGSERLGTEGIRIAVADGRVLCAHERGIHRKRKCAVQTRTSVGRGVTVTVLTNGMVPWFVAAKAAMLPLPDAANPVCKLLLVQVYVVPATELAKATAVVFSPWQAVWLEMGLMSGEGFTVMVKELWVRYIAFAVGVTVTVAVTGTLVALVPLKAAMFPFPDARQADGRCAVCPCIRGAGLRGRQMPRR